MGQRLGQRGLAESGQVLHEQMTLSEQAADRKLHRRIVREEDLLHCRDDQLVLRTETLGLFSSERAARGEHLATFPHGGAHRRLTTAASKPLSARGRG